MGEPEMTNPLVEAAIEAMDIALSAALGYQPNGATRRAAERAFYAQRDIVCVVPPRATGEMLAHYRAHGCLTGESTFEVMAAAGDLTKPKE